MELNKITESDLSGKGVVGQPEVPGLSAEEMQAKVEEIVRGVAIVKINEIIDYLKENGATKADLESVVINAGAVTSVHGRRGSVVAQKGDYNAEMVGAAERKHASEHLPEGSDPIDLDVLGASKKEHFHGNIEAGGNIGNTNGKIIMTGVGGILEAKEKSELGFVTEPVLVATSGAISFTAEENREYEYTGVTSLTMVGANVSCHGTIVFGSSTPSVSISGFSASGGDDIFEAKANETWEFSCFGNRILWKNWGVI
ncbi:MAG: hypothetical protein IJ406_03205 [Oscillospiraceae bacterium]|nr:hypothetical protein [Oscillospiraceae bacterium]